MRKMMTYTGVLLGMMVLAGGCMQHSKKNILVPEPLIANEEDASIPAPPIT